MNAPPLSVPALPAFDPSNGKAIRAIFRHAPQLKFGQSWTKNPSPALCKGTVRVGWQEDRLVYLADLDDHDLFTKATRRNQRLWELGDVLEVFAGVHKNPGYIEYHTAPNGKVLHLFWPNEVALARFRLSNKLTPLKRIDRTSEAHVFIRQGGWLVLGWVTSAALGLPPGTRLGRQLLDLNFGRYDRGPERMDPVLSSTSPLTKAAFHRRHEWTKIHLNGRELS